MLVAAYAGSTRQGGNNNRVNCLIWNALNNATIPADYRPPCEGTVAVIALPCGGVLADNPPIAQITIASVPFPDNCECGVSGGKLWDC